MFQVRKLRFTGVGRFFQVTQVAQFFEGRFAAGAVARGGAHHEDQAGNLRSAHLHSSVGHCEVRTLPTYQEDCAKRKK